MAPAQALITGSEKGGKVTHPAARRKHHPGCSTNGMALAR